MEITLGMEFQTPDYNVMVLSDQNKILYYYSVKKNIELSDDTPSIDMTGDAPTSQKIKFFNGEGINPEQYFYNQWIQQKASQVQITLNIQKQAVPKKFKIPINESILQIFNDAEFLITFTNIEKWEVDRLSVINGIINKLKMGSRDLEKTLKEKTTKLKVGSLKLLSTQNTQIRNLTSGEFPYKAGYSLTDLDQETYFLLSHQSGMTLSKAQFYTQITMCVSLMDIIKVMAILTDECKRHFNKLDPNDQQQLLIFPTIIEELVKIIGNKALIKQFSSSYIICILLIYSFRTRKNRKASPFLIRHYMVNLINLLSELEQEIMGEWINSFQDDEMTDYTSFIYANLRLQRDPKQLKSMMDQHQNNFTSTIFSLKNQFICFEFRYLYALLKAWTGEELCTFQELKTIPLIRSRDGSTSIKPIQTFI